MNRFTRLSVLITGLLLITLLSACGDPTAPTTTGVIGTPSSVAKIKVVATTTQIGDFVKNVGGNRVELVTILKPGVAAHDYEPTSDDSKALAAAQIIFTNGVGLEEWLDKTIKNSGTKAIQVVTSDGIKPRPGSNAEEKSGDPHIWFSTENAKKMLDNISTGLTKIDGAGKDFYEANAKSYKAQIDDMTKQVKILVDTIPADRRKLVTNHDAFGYFAEQFGIKIVGSVIPSFDSTAEPSAQELKELVDKIKAEKVPAIFTETSINPKLAEQISKEAGVKIFSNLYGDTLGEAGSDGDTYLKMMLANANNIANGLK
jgi:zinc/manganese transport system substrate-binding protein/manganese/iron transport system substrate-binding protein